MVKVLCINEIDKDFRNWRVTFASVVDEKTPTTAGISELLSQVLWVKKHPQRLENLRKSALRSICVISVLLINTQKENPIRKVNLSKSSMIIFPFSNNSDL